MAKKSKTQQTQEDLNQTIGCLISIPIVAFVAFQIFFSGGGSSPDTSDPRETERIYSTPSPEERAASRCLDAVKNKYASLGYDAGRLASQRVTMSEREDGSFFTTIAVPFRTTGAVTGKRNRVFWINVECVVGESVLPKITEIDSAGYPG